MTAKGCKTDYLDARVALFYVLVQSATDRNGVLTTPIRKTRVNTSLAGNRIV